MLFGTGSKLSGMFATHPPLTDRIQALDPNFKASDYPEVDLRSRSTVSDGTPASAVHEGVTTALAGGTAAALSESISDMVGDPENEHVTFASHLRQSVPELLYDAAHSHELAYLLVVALILDRSGRVIDRQMQLITERLGDERTRLVRQYFDELSTTGAEYRLPLMEIAFPALKRRPAPRLSYLIDLAGRLIDVDGEIDLYEFCFYRILVSNLGQASDPSRRLKTRRGAREPVRRAATNLLRVIAQHGHSDNAARRRAYDAGIAVFGKWGAKYPYDSGQQTSVSVLDESLETLLALNSKGKQMLLEAVTATVMSDKNLSVSEAELIRAICASLDCPLPPILIDR